MHLSSVSRCESLEMAAALRFLFVLLIFSVSEAASFDYPTAALGTRWILNPGSGTNHSVDFFDGSQVQALLLHGSLGPRFACGFFCAGSSCAGAKNKNKFRFGTFIVITNSGSGIVMPALGFPQPIWYANRQRPVSPGASLQLTSNGNLELRESSGELVWESHTANSGVEGMALDESGNLILHGSNKSKIIWQSFDHPSDAIVPGQILRPGMKLIASASASNASGGQYYLAMEEQGLALYASASPHPQIYWQRKVEPATAGKSAFAQYRNGSIDIFVTSPARNLPDATIRLARIQSAQYLKLAHDGRLLLFAWDDERGWIQALDVLQSEQQSPAKCNLPSACSRFGVCTDDGECSCPSSFTHVDSLRPSKGCVPPQPYKCSSKNRFLELKGIDYFANDFSDGISGTSLKQCLDSCSRQCSCRAAFYKNGANAANPAAGGICYLISEIYTLRNSYRGPGYTSIAYLKL